ncbi:MAG: hypothetical protein ACJ75J_17715 [Cytophagaceae bacterium]
MSYRPWELSVRKIISRFINRIPRKTPDYFLLEYYSTYTDIEKRLLQKELITLTPDKIVAEYISKNLRPGVNEEKAQTSRKEEYSLKPEDFRSYYSFLRKYRFDLIREPYIHNSYDSLTQEWNSAILIKYGCNKEEGNYQTLEARNSMDLGIEGKDRQRFEIFVHRLRKLVSR